jgi:hypothetical protein
LVLPAVLGIMAVADAARSARDAVGTSAALAGGSSLVARSQVLQPGCPGPVEVVAERVATADGIADATTIHEAVAAYCAAAAAYAVDWTVVAGVGFMECRHGRGQEPGCNPPGTVNGDGARGPMQFLGSTWRCGAGQHDLDVAGPPVPPEQQGCYGTDGDGDGIADPWSWPDAAYSAARYLVALGVKDDPERAAFHYFHGGGAEFSPGHWYPAGVLAAAERYRAAAADLVPMPSGPIHVLGSTDRYTETSITPTMQRLLDTVVPLFGQGHGIGCYRDGTWGEHPLGRACDFIMQVPLNTMPTREYLDHGWQMANWLVEHAAELDVYYIIWQKRIWSSNRADEGWRTYTHPEAGENASLQQNHYDHVHVSVL